MKNMRHSLKGLAAFFFILFNMLLCAIPFYCLMIVYFFIPLRIVRLTLKKGMLYIAHFWVHMNSFVFRFGKVTCIHLTCNSELSPQQWYFLVANHQSAADIFILQEVLHQRAPFLKFFLKQELLYVPIMGLIWWALDYPFMRRQNSTNLQTKTQNRMRDIVSTRIACKKSTELPATIVNFMEGTRFTEEKKLLQRSPYKNLLRPTLGSTAFVLSELQETLDAFLDVTIKYHGGKTLWDLICGKIVHTHVDINVIPIHQIVTSGKIIENKQALTAYRKFINQIWERKDRLLEST